MNTKEIEIMTQVIEVFVENNCSVETIETIAQAIIPVAKQCSTLQKELYLETMVDVN